MIRAVIFDLDGTLFDNEPLISESYRLVLESYGATPTLQPHGLYHPVGMRGIKTWVDMKKTYGITEDIEVLLKKRRAHNMRLLQGQLSPMPGVIQLLQLLQSKHILIALATGSSVALVDTILEKIAIKKFFDVIITGEDTPESKPNPEAFVLASKQLAIPPQDCLAIEDSLPGVQAAKTAGMKAIAVPTMYTKDEDFSQADVVVDSLEKVDWKLFQSL